LWRGPQQESRLASVPDTQHFLSADRQNEEAMNTERLAFERSILLAAGLVLIFGLISGARGLSAPAGPDTQDKPTRSKPLITKDTPAPAKELAMPFHVGETLTYRVAWSAFPSAASLQVSVPERRNLFGWGTWHFRASLHTQRPVRNLFVIDDEFDSYADAATMETHQYESYLNELGRKTNEVLHFVPVGQTSRAPAPDVIVLPGTRDPVGVLYALRRVDWQRTPEFHAPLYDGHDVYQLSARLDAKSDMISVAAGNFPSSRLAVRLSQKNKQLADINFEVWLANDAARTPVQFQAQLPFGSVRAELMSLAK
jgi:hypothetical protein